MPKQSSISFAFDKTSAAGVESVSLPGVSASRRANLNEGDQRINEDNGFAAYIDTTLDSVAAQKLLADTFYAVRGGAAIPGNDHAETTAASAVLTQDGIALRNAGDSAVLAIGKNGAAIMLSQLQTQEIELLALGYDPGWAIRMRNVITNALTPGETVDNAGTEVEEKDFKSFITWEDIEAQLGEDLEQVIAASDGLFGGHKSATEISQHVTDLIKDNGVNSAHDRFAEELMDAAVYHPDNVDHMDDIVIVAGRRPETGTVILHAFDGVGSGGRDSARVAFNATVTAKNIVDAVPTAKTPGGRKKGPPRP